MKVVVLGASDQSDRFSYMAIRLLQKYDHEVLPVHPQLQEILGLPVFSALEKIQERYHTLTVYLNPRNQERIHDQILATLAQRIIFNPGSENPDWSRSCSSLGRVCSMPVPW